MKKAVFGILSSEQNAQKAVEELQRNGFSNEEISVILPDRRKGRPTSPTTSSTDFEEDLSFQKPTSKKGSFGYEKTSKGPEGGATGALTGGIIGGSIGLLAGIGALAIPGVGPFIAAGPILAALSGSAIGGSVGLLVGYLVGLGIPEYEAKKYESSLKQGNTLVIVHTETTEEVNLATEILEKNGAKDVSNTAEKTKRF